MLSKGLECLRTFHPRDRPPQQRQLLDAGREDSKRKEEKKNGPECWDQSSRCPACNQECDALLILPCSHFMCHQCVAAEEGLQQRDSQRRRAASLPPCAVWCPSCRHPVELPCWDWSSATSCLPARPRVNQEAAHGGQLQQVRESELRNNLCVCFDNYTHTHTTCTCPCVNVCMLQYP